MAREATPIDIRSMPEVTHLIEEARRTNTTLALHWGDEEVATLSLVRPPQRRHRTATRLLDTSALPPVPYRTVDEVMASRPVWGGRAFTDEEIAAALEEERAQAWQRKSS